MSECQKCNSERVITVCSHASDLHAVIAPHLDYDHDGYLPYIPNIGGGDDVEMDVCLECGQVQGEWPVSDSVLREDDDDGISHDDFEKRMIEGLKDLPDEEAGVALQEYHYNREEILDPNSTTLLDALIPAMTIWLNDYEGLWRLDEDYNDWSCGSIVFKNRYIAAKFAEEFDLSWVSPDAAKRRDYF